MLSISKYEFPKLLSLDQNKWIDLSRAHYNHSNGKDFQYALDAVRVAVKNRKLVVPFSEVHMVETEGGSNAERRERLLRFVVDLSGNLSISPFMTVRAWEIRNAVFAMFGQNVPGDIRRSIVRYGSANALALKLTISGLPKHSQIDKNALFEIIESAENTLEYYLKRGYDREASEQFRADELGTLAHQELVRLRSASEITSKQRLLHELIDHIHRGEVGIAIQAALNEFDMSLSKFYDSFPSATEFVNFFSEIPCLDVMLKLTLARDQDLIRPIHRNDARDFHWLQVAANQRVKR